jgi:hypothetical protein
MTWPIFAALYYLVVTPLAILVRVFKGDPLARTPDPRTPHPDTYWIQRAPVARERFERQS